MARWRAYMVVAAAALISSTAASAQNLIIEHVTVIDGTGGPNMANKTVIIRDGRIRAIQSGKAKTNSPTRKIDGRGKYLMPGLIDVHTHVPYAPDAAKNGLPDPGQTSLQSYLYAGVTTVFDAFNNPDYIFKLRDDEHNGKLLSPRLYTAGAVITYPKSWSVTPTSILVDAWPEDQAAVDVNLARQPDLQKITYENFGAGANPYVQSFSPELFTTMTQYIIGKGIKPIVHISSEPNARVAIAAGVDRLAHPVTVAKISDDLVTMIKTLRVMTATTLAVFDNISRVTDDPSFLDTPAMRAVMEDKQIEDFKKGRGNYIKMGWGSWFKSTLAFSQQNLKRLHDAGAVLALGTDRALGPLVHRELELIVEAGIPPAAAIRIATLNGAAYLGKEAEFGSVTPGKWADLVLLNADPTVDIKNVSDIAAVFKGGAEIDRGQLDLPINRKK